MPYPYELNELQSENTNFPWEFNSAGTGYNRNPFSSNTNLYDLNSQDYSLTKPIDVTIIEEVDCFRAESEDLNLWATGRDIKDALNQLKKEIVILYQELRAESENNLGPRPKSWWQFLQTSILE